MDMPPGIIPPSVKRYRTPETLPMRIIAHGSLPHNRPAPKQSPGAQVFMEFVGLGDTLPPPDNWLHPPAGDQPRGQIKLGAGAVAGAEDRELRQDHLAGGDRKIDVAKRSQGDQTA